jgi:hypothetical protein
MRDFELELSELIYTYRNRYDRQKVIEALNAQAGLLVGDDGWVGDRPGPERLETEPESPPAEDSPMGETEAAATDPTAA